MRHSSKNAIPTKPQKQPAIAQNFHIKKSGGEKKEGKKSEGQGYEREKKRGSSGGGGGVGMPSSRRTTRLPWDLRGKEGRAAENERKGET